MITKRIILVPILFIMWLMGYTQSQLKVTLDGVLVPQGDHTTIQNPDEGLLMYDSLTSSFWFYNISEWEEIGNDGDKDSTNEFQDLSASGTGDTLHLSNGGFLIVPGISEANQIEDADGNIYTTTTIAGRIWLTENLKTTKFNDGTPIPNVSDFEDWEDLTTPGRCYFDNDSTAYASLFGALYNWYVVDSLSNGNKNVCPVGFRVADVNDVEAGMFDESGLALSELLFQSPNPAGWLDANGHTNDSGFSALGGGIRFTSFSTHIFAQKFENLRMWLSDESTSSNGEDLEISDYGYINQGHSTDKESGQSIRCVKE